MTTPVNDGNEAARPQEPELSIVIASINGRTYLERCLAALDRQTGGVRAEIIVADCVGSSVTDFVRRHYPNVHLIGFDTPQSVPALRSAGILVARGGIIVITEDHCLPEPDWYTAIVQAHQEWAGPAIGGAVDNAATTRQIDWAVYLCEYSNFISPVSHGVVHDLPGPNVSYKRGALAAMADLVRDGYWETFLHYRLESEGFQLWSDPRIRVRHLKNFTFMSFLRERFHYARAFAGHRNEFISPPRRLFYLLASPLLPPLLMFRLWRRVRGHAGHTGPFIRSLPYILLFMVAWAIGECVGYAAGPGQSELQLS